ncbi:N-acetyltransferase [Actinoplanes lobatus]|uniref:N-acetyltransferase n=1 Tax=Actinoplanes lobatus TaxID=113568 RepID=A0A7W7HDB4_9ACTN|nr:GNAT family N-acetyltransferase [Actinoplanes lobatus]MBB4748437.1 putative GNAT family acetyltransferase [Actinoplanes lobatus]GGN57158.1 N-acetyltransferase [Actinoplanes lobatus]GIE37661.1 N-acetyltransferase [Actinoplanes lobatus]
MTWHLTSDVETFAATAGTFLSSSPVRHTVLLTVVAALRFKGPHAYGESDPILGWWTTPSGEVSGALVRTPPYPLTLTGTPPEAVPAAAEALATTPLTAVNLPAEAVPAFIEAWTSLVGGTARLGRRTRLFRLERLTPPAEFPPGTARLATAADRPLLLDWFQAFHDYIGEQPPDLTALVDDRIESRGVTLWERDGTPVSMAARSRPEAGMTRIQFVYTPPPHRRHGYGAAATTEATRYALDAGATEVVLFTDLANPASNALYPRLGYRPTEDRAVVEFSP